MQLVVTFIFFLISLFLFTNLAATPTYAQCAANNAAACGSENEACCSNSWCADGCSCRNGTCSSASNCGNSCSVGGQRCVDVTVGSVTCSATTTDDPFCTCRTDLGQGTTTCNGQSVNYVGDWRGQNPCPTYTPDLIVENSLSINPAQPGASSNITFSAVVKNQGNGSAGSSSTSLKIDYNNDGSWNLQPPTGTTNQATPGLGPSESTNGTLLPRITWTLDWTGKPAGTHKFEVCADVGSAVSESNESNNCTSTTFTIYAPPSAPIPICNTSSPPSGVADDVCNGNYAGPNKNKLSIRDSGPATSSFPHAYQFLLQEVSGSQTTTWVSAGSKTQALINANPIYSFPATTLASNFTSDPRNLVNGNSYQWQAQTIGADGQSSSLSPVWTFVYDNVAPIPQITNFSLKCYTSSTLPPNILVNALDNSEGSGVDRVYVKIYNTTDSLYYSGTQDLSTTAPTPPDTNPYTFNLNQSLMSINKIYEISAKAVDKVSNESAYTPPYKFAYMNRCFDPWIQTSGGDVHANTSFTTSTNTP